MKGPRAVSPLPRDLLSILAMGVACLPLALPDVGAAQQTSQYGPDRAEYDAELGDVPAYRATQARLASGWNTWDSRSVLRYVLLPEGMTVDLAIKQHRWLGEGFLGETLIGRSGEGREVVRPGMRSYDGSYMELELLWMDNRIRVQAGTDEGELVVLVTPLATAPLAPEVVLSVGFPWSAEGTLTRVGETLVGHVGGRDIAVHSTGRTVEDPYVRTLAPHRVLRVDGPMVVGTGRARTVAEARAALEARRAELQAEAERFGVLSEAYLAVQAGVAWNTIFEPRHGRVVSTVGRLWNEEYGGSAMFGWDNFFLAYLTSLASRDLAVANVIEQLRGHTAEGFFPNDNRGNGSKSWDRAQPPVGGIMVREVYRRYPERWLLEASFEPLLAANRWWPEKRFNSGLLSYGSHEAPNPFGEPSVRTVRTAGYESGMDDSPMYEGVPFNPSKNTLELQDVGLNSLYIADCLALAEMAALLGRTSEEAELRDRAQRFTAAMESLWDEDRGYFLNRRTDTGELSWRRSPTLFYPMLAGVASADRANRLVLEHLLNPDEFWGEWVLPSTTRDDPSFPRQRYWKGAIWPPLNFLTYLSLRTAGFDDEAAELSRRSLALLLGEWERKGYVSENYSSITGTGDDERLSSDPFHSWGALFGIMAFIDQGYLSAPEEPMPRPERRP
jgi:hypothetical protein